MATAGSKSSHSPRRSRRTGNGRPSRSSSRPRSDRTRPAPKAPAEKVEAPAAGQPERVSVQLESLAKREVEIRRVPLARPFENCPRCANHHPSLELKPLSRAPEGFSHFATCPNLGEPILLQVAGA